MNAQGLLEVYEQISEAPDAIARLRRFVLDLAVRGKLVEQDGADEPASVLLDRITERKAKILSTSGMRKPRKVPDMDLSSVTFEIPSNWSWTQISELGFISPRNEGEDGEAASFVPMPMIYAEYGALNEHEPRIWGEIKKG
jgi:type I restriction enzyme S subunit